ncbi:MAG: hypothetical protein H6747_00540 [Deltaproteobacteria bacterium]|nr:hypothetical protein [Deltaproteobacteria bacterium]
MAGLQRRTLLAASLLLGLAGCPRAAVDGGAFAGADSGGAGMDGDTAANDAGVTDTAATDTSKSDAGATDTATSDTASTDLGDETTAGDAADPDSGAADVLDGCSGGCDDGDPCTTDACVSGACSSKPTAGGGCFGGGTCTAGTCFAEAKGPFRDLFAGYDATCAVSTQGVHCWGANTKGQLGAGEKAGFGGSTTPLPVAASGAQRMIGRSQTICTLLQASGSKLSVACWGDNFWGQLGNGNPQHQDAPVAFPSTADVTSFAVGDRHVCVRTSDGALACSGSDSDGQLGDGTVGDKTSLPIVLPGTKDWLRVYAGGETTCAVRPAGALWCWGDNEYGEVGVGSSKKNLPTPQDTGLRGVSSVAIGDDHVCAVTPLGPYCWGANTSGQVAQTGAGPFLTPKPVAVDAVEVLANDNASCAIGADAKLRCWGSNQQKVIDPDASSTVATPMLVAGLGTIRRAALAEAHLCVIDTGGHMRCRGYNSNGELGNGSTKPSFAWVEVTPP